ncbi:site-specific tyrosine recombinase XerD [soil metagenome]
MPKQSSSITLTEAYQLLMLDNQARRFTKSTMIFYRDCVGRFITWCAQQSVTLLLYVTTSLIRAYLVYLQGRKLSSHTINKEARAVRRFFNFCVGEELLTQSPMKKVSMPKVDKLILPSLTVMDVRKLLQACRTHKEEAIILFLLDTGLRVSEFVNLNSEDIDTTTGEVTVHQGKGQKDRTVFLGAKARKKLLRYYIERKRPDAKQPVWLSENTKKRLTGSGLFQLLRRIATRTDVEHYNPHTFRRTFALWSLRAGMDVYSLKELMGHADLNTLLKYLGLTKEDLQRAHNEHGAVDNML